MNKRVNKKVKKRLNCKTYAGYRQKRIINIAEKYIDDNVSKANTDGMNIIYIVYPKKNRNNKHVRSVQLLLDAYPSAMS